jgi:alginate O-acetyltransferase complex protein AlgJ
MQRPAIKPQTGEREALPYRPPLDIVRARPRPKPPRRPPWPVVVAQRVRAAWLHAMGPAHRMLAWNAVLFIALVLVLGVTGLARSLDFRATGHPDVWKGKLAHAFETHYDKGFPLKNLGVNLWAAADYELFGEGRPGVVVGKDGWLYTDEEFKLANDSPALVDRHLALIDWVRRTLAQRHVALLVAVVPAKARVYPEHLGHRQPPPLRRDLYAQTLDTLHAEGVPAMGLLPALHDGKRQRPTFLRTDTHWTPYGAQQAAQAIAAHLGNDVAATGTFHTETFGTQVHRGDLFNFLPLGPWFASLLPPPDQLREVRTVADARGGGLLGGAPAPAVALVGTSYSAEPQWNFAGALEQALHADVLNYAKAGEGPFAPMLAYLGSADFRSAPPKLVVWEVPERYLPLPQPALAAYHLPPDAFAVHAAPPAASGGPLAREGGSSRHVQGNL